MRFFKNISNGYIVAISTESGKKEISANEYNDILVAIKSCSTPPEGFDYRLKESLEWELYELPPVPPEEPSYEELLEAVEIYKGGDFDE